MKIAFDASDLCTNRADGTTRYTRELVKRLPLLALEDTWDFYGPNFLPSYEGRRGGVDTQRNYPLPSPMAGCSPSYEGEKSNVHWKSSPFPFAWTQTRFAWEIFKNKPDVLFMPIQQLPIFRPNRTKTVAVIHDLAFHTYSKQFRYKDWLLLHTFSAQVANEADAIIAVSEATKTDIKKFYGREHNVHVVHHGIDHNQFRVFSEYEKTKQMSVIQEKYPEITGPYILFVGQIQPRKNIVRLVEAFEMLHADFLPSYEGRRGGVDTQRNYPLPSPMAGCSPSYEGEKSRFQLVIAGGHGWNNEEIYKRIAQSPARENIVVTGAVPDELLPGLYANAEVFVLPSLQEGFGIPLIEAAACGTPLVTSNVSSMKEIVGSAGVLIDPNHAVSLKDGILDALDHKEVYSTKSIAMASTFSWDTTARETLRILKGVISL